MCAQRCLCVVLHQKRQIATHKHKREIGAKSDGEIIAIVALFETKNGIQ